MAEYRFAGLPVRRPTGSPATGSPVYRFAGPASLAPLRRYRFAGTASPVPLRRSPILRDFADKCAAGIPAMSPCSQEHHIFLNSLSGGARNVLLYTYMIIYVFICIYMYTTEPDGAFWGNSFGTRLGIFLSSWRVLRSWRRLLEQRRLLIYKWPCGALLRL